METGATIRGKEEINMENKRRFSLSSPTMPLVITFVLFLALYFGFSFRYTPMLKPQVFYNIFIDNATILILAVGITYVLLIGGIDISVGSVVALVCMATAYLLEFTTLHPVVVMILMLIMGAVFGLVQGTFITYFDMQPFIVTLAGQYFARGMTAVINEETIHISNKVYQSIARFQIKLPGGFISPIGLLSIIVLIISIFVLQYTKFGRNIYAIGGSETSALLMGLPVKRTKLAVYTLSGFLSALAGVTFSIYMLSGYTLHAMGMEMDAIASSVIGGTSLTGGVGYVLGSLFGTTIQGTIKTIISLDGTINSWYTRIIVAALLCVFIVMQSIFTKSKERVKRKEKSKAKTTN